jgi:hypothetical protein
MVCNGLEKIIDKAPAGGGAAATQFSRCPITPARSGPPLSQARGKFHFRHLHQYLPGAITEKVNRFAQSQALPGLRPDQEEMRVAFDNTHLVGERSAANAPEGQMAFRENSRIIPFQCQRT